MSIHADIFNGFIFRASQVDCQGFYASVRPTLMMAVHSLLRGNTVGTKNSSSQLIDDLVQKLEMAIFRGDYAPGTRIREARIAVDLRVGRSAVREAVRQLEGRKLIVRLQNQGIFVTKLSDKDLLELLEIRVSLEVAAIRLAAERITADELTVLRHSMARHAEASVNRLQRLYSDWHNFDFHYQIAKASGNDRLLAMLCGDIWFLMRTYRYPEGLSPPSLGFTYADHNSIFNALEARDADACERLMRDHLQHLRIHLEEHNKAVKAAPEQTNLSRQP